ncbi:GNAT family N-acetyltransferase [Ensifer adhaerens]|uniref:GNAT family N-acetyltransferase n=2 Tax=Ensifer adhaerens TaxID=106592 RepID=UPI001CEFE335|nr:GNAT family N-acetyltransferase [Ensifer adhaerens]MBW0371380.1 GNAT family N-acetyltransferase [Ensifer adhaerens]UCM24398.1 GNAT family N-acetyltransferase [Ensifer adhaerens]
MTTMKIGPTKSEDISALKMIVEKTELFPSEMLPDMLSSFLSAEESKDIWLTCEDDRTAIGFCYAAPEPLAEGTWNMLAIAVSPPKQGAGVGAAIVEKLESVLRERGHRVLIADTSGTDPFRQTREFYRKNGYTEEARIRDFWGEGDDKVIFWKRL